MKTIVFQQIVILFQISFSCPSHSMPSGFFSYQSTQPHKLFSYSQRLYLNSNKVYNFFDFIEDHLSLFLFWPLQQAHRARLQQSLFYWMWLFFFWNYYLYISILIHFLKNLSSFQQFLNKTMFKCLISVVQKFRLILLFSLLSFPISI